MTKNTMHLEITYDYHPTARHKAEHWMYYAAPGKDFEECKKNAEKYFHKQIRGLGWGKITTLTGIGPIRKYDSKPKRVDHPVESDPKALAEQKTNAKRKTPSRRKRAPVEGAAAKPRPKRKTKR